MWRSVATAFPPVAADYVELRCATAFSFLRGASLPEEIVRRAFELGYRRIAITDHDGLYGVARAHMIARENGLEILVGSEVHLSGNRQSSLLLFASDRRSYGRLVRLLSTARLRMGKGG